jgi:hypothetical protein
MVEAAERHHSFHDPLRLWTTVLPPPQHLLSFELPEIPFIPSARSLFLDRPKHAEWRGLSGPANPLNR